MEFLPGQAVPYDTRIPMRSRHYIIGFNCYDTAKEYNFFRDGRNARMR